MAVRLRKGFFVGLGGGGSGVRIEDRIDGSVGTFRAACSSRGSVQMGDGGDRLGVQAWPLELPTVTSSPHLPNLCFTIQTGVLECDIALGIWVFCKYVCSFSQCCPFLGEHLELSLWE